MPLPKNPRPKQTAAIVAMNRAEALRLNDLGHSIKEIAFAIKRSHGIVYGYMRHAGFHCMLVTKAERAEIIASRLEATDSQQRLVGWTNGRALSPRYHGTPRFPLAIYRTEAEAKREFGLDAVRAQIVPANTELTDAKRSV